MSLPKEVEGRFERIEGYLEETAILQVETRKEMRFLVSILRETLSHSRENTKRLDKLEAELDEVREKVPA